MGVSTEEEAGRNDDHEGERFHRGGDQLRAAAPLDAAPLQDEKSDDDQHGNELDVSGQRTDKFAAVFADDDGDGGRGAAGGKPVAPADDEAGILTERAARKVILAAAARNCRAEFGQGRRAGERIESPDDPDAEEEINIGEPLRNVAGRPYDSSGDRVTNRGGYSEPHAENFEQAATAAWDLSGIESGARRSDAGRGSVGRGR